MTDTPVLTGRCLCGTVRFQITAAPVFSGHCACDNCRRGTGAEHASIFAVPAETVSAEGETSQFAHPADSGATVTRHFCPNCGSHCWSQNSNMAALQVFPVGGLDDPSAITPAMFVYHAKRAPWDRAGETCQTFDAMPPLEP